MSKSKTQQVVEKETVNQFKKRKKKGETFATFIKNKLSTVRVERLSDCHMRCGITFERCQSKPEWECPYVAEMKEKNGYVPIKELNLVLYGPSPGFSCPECDKIFKTEKAMLIHKASHK